MLVLLQVQLVCDASGQLVELGEGANSMVVLGILGGMEVAVKVCCCEVP